MSLTRFALVLAAFLALVLSAGFTSTQLREASHRGQLATQQRIAKPLSAADAAIALAVRPAPPRAQILSAPSTSDGPAPALLIYLVLVLVGSAVSIAIVRRNQA